MADLPANQRASNHGNLGSAAGRVEANRVAMVARWQIMEHLPTWRSCLAASAEARLAKVTNPTGEAVLPFLLVTFNNDPS